ncbi:hypothetical protein BV898_07213 [Hypsibius exemplaris]|uniref:Uncharacterized protein n=1 Tax=Hypsibius exemplaris TaxID=2072580 RepID=A0A1W0WUA2_HYPEX|nr:hypothetical protein BV898_07213 [Hypsibius exemplaris]
MPFMLKPCGHALRFSQLDGICRRCTGNMDVEGAAASGGETDYRVNAENVEPPAAELQHQDGKKPFLDQVEKLVAVMINSEEPELVDAVTHVARNMSTFTAGERGDFVYELVIRYCEARREDQPKIDFLLKELGKKNVLARPHFIQSAKRLISETAALSVDWPNIYDCTVDLIGTNLSLLKNPSENLEAFGKLLNGASGEHAGKFLLPLRRHFPSVHIPDAKDGRNPVTASSSSGQPRTAVGFFLPPAAAKDKFIRPVGLRSPSPPRPSRRTYSREAMLRIELNRVKFALPEGLLERVKIVKNDTWVAPPSEMMTPDRSDGGQGLLQGKRPRFVSESGMSAGDMGGTPSTKRMLESTSPPLLMGQPGGQHHHLRGTGGDWKYAAGGQRDSHDGHSFTGGSSSLTGFDRPRFVSESADKHHSGSTFQSSPKKSYQEPHHPHHDVGSRVRHDSFNPASATSAATPTATVSHQAAKPEGTAPRPSPPRNAAPSGSAGAGPGGKAPSGGPSSRPGSGKTKKFLTALNVDRITETDTSQLSPTLSPNVKTWSRGSGSLNTFSLKPGAGGTSPLKDANKAFTPLAVPARTFGLSPGNGNQPQPRSSPGGPMDDHHRSSHVLHRGSPGNGPIKPDHHHQPEQNWRRGLSQA